MIAEARGGGSMTPEYKKILKTLVADGKIELWEHTVVVGANWNEELKSWKVTTEPRMEMPTIDHVVYATGAAVDFGSIEAIQPLLKEFPIQLVAGMPCLTNDLMWNEEVPFFVTGRLAGLRVGPGAGNLEGARQGSERIAWKVGELLREMEVVADSSYGSGGEKEGEVDERRLGLGIQNQFEVLGICDE